MIFYLLKMGYMEIYEYVLGVSNKNVKVGV